jgi:hypothetical protein
MSLIINFIAKKDDFNLEELENEIKYPRNELFGVESWRANLWGHKIMKSIGCELIYSLQDSNIIAIDEDIIRLKVELNRIILNIDKISNVTNINKIDIEFRVLNAIEYIKIAEKNINNVGVIIW